MATITIRNSQGQIQTLTPEQLQATDSWLYSFFKKWDILLMGLGMVGECNKIRK